MQSAVTIKKQGSSPHTATTKDIRLRLQRQLFQRQRNTAPAESEGGDLFDMISLLHNMTGVVWECQRHKLE